MELRVLALRQQQQQAQPGNLIPLRNIDRESIRWQLIERLQLLNVAGESLRVAGANGEDGALLVRLACECENGLRDGRRGSERFEVEEGEFGFGEEGVGFGVAHGGVALELGEDLGEGAFGHGGGWGQRLAGMEVSQRLGSRVCSFTSFGGVKLTLAMWLFVVGCGFALVRAERCMDRLGGSADAVGGLQLLLETGGGCSRRPWSYTLTYISRSA